MMITNPIKIRQDWVRFFLFSMNIYLDLLLGKSCLCKCLRVSQLTLPIRQNLFLLFFAILNYSLRNIRIEESRGVSTTATILGHTIRLISDMMGTCRVSENQIISEKWLECNMKKDFLQFIPKISKEFLQFFFFFFWIPEQGTRQIFLNFGVDFGLKIMLLGTLTQNVPQFPRWGKKLAVQQHWQHWPSQKS